MIGALTTGLWSSHASATFAGSSPSPAARPLQPLLENAFKHGVEHYLLLTLYGVGLASLRGPWDWFDAQRRVSLAAGACCSVAACSRRFAPDEPSLLAARRCTLNR
jgi:hypothetical protein